MRGATRPIFRIAVGGLAVAVSLAMPIPVGADEEETVSEPNKVTIEEYYQRAKPADDLMPGARIGDYQLFVKGLHWTFLNGRWNEIYSGQTEQGETLRAVLRNAHGFDADRFDSFCRWKKDELYKVIVFNEGYLLLSPKSKFHKIVIPIPPALAKRLQKL